MCLIVNSPKMIAETDLVVYKVLCNSPEFTTPYQHTPIKFENGQCLLVMNGEKVLDLDFIYIKKGIHAYCLEYLAQTSICFYWCHWRVHYAIIPKGCEYYLGTNGEIVSTEMIIFKTDKDYLKYEQEHEVKPVK